MAQLGEPKSRAELRERIASAARHGNRLTYTEAFGNRYIARSKPESIWLGDVAKEQHLADGGPLLTAIVVLKETGWPSRGLWDLAREHDSPSSWCGCGTQLIRPGESQPAFLARQVGEVHQFWAAPSGTMGTTNRNSPGPALGARNRNPFTVNPDAIDRANAGHRTIQDRLENRLRDAGIDPLYPVLAFEPDYDLGWRTRSGYVVCEIKSLTETNEILQLRLGLGQVVHYRYQLSRRDRVVHAVLAVERQPRDPAWVEICGQHGVRLIWPPDFSTLDSTQDLWLLAE